MTLSPHSTTARATAPERPWIGWALGVVLALLCVQSLSRGLGDEFVLGFGEVLQGGRAALGLGAALDGMAQVVFEVRLERTLLTVGVGAGLALSGALLQGVFRNDLASPGLLGVTSGASLGASIAILALGGYGHLFLIDAAEFGSAAVVGAMGFVGAAGVTLLVTLLGTSQGRISVPTLLLVGIAVNAVAGGLVAAIQSFALGDFDVSRALFAWGFGTLEDRGATQVGLVLAAVAISAAVVPFVAVELDLFVAGEDDARALGVDTTRVKWLALGASALSAGAAVAVAGQIAFVGLIVPHLVRRLASRSHRRLLPLCLLAGPVLLLAADMLQRVFFAEAGLRPGVTMSLLGGPFFLFLLVRDRRRLAAW